MKFLRLLAPAAAALLMLGCQKNIQTDEAVRDAVIKHLESNKNLQVGSMDISVANVTFKDNAAEATISFKPKGGDPNSGMSMRYSLEKKGGAWEVVKKADSGMGGGHGAMPPGGAMPPADSGMPADHPPMGGAAKK